MANPKNTRLIPLSQGKFAIVDAEDYAFLMQWKWCANKNGNTFYAKRFAKTVNGKYKLILMHRLINKTPKHSYTDHKNGNGLDNRKSNIRTATINQNGANRKKNKIGTSKYKGVTWNKALGKWKTYIRVNKELIHLGYFTNEEEAANAYRDRARIEFGEFARH